MELEGEDGTKIKLELDTETVFGRGSGFDTKDRTVSRRHILFNTNSQTKPTTSAAVSLEVLGKNPIWVHSKNSSNGGGGRERGIRVFRRFERGEVEAGDWLCVCGQNPVWFTVKNRRNDSEKFGDCVDASNIDPIKEFGFLLIGHEFDQYPKQRIRDVKDWDWFLEEHRKNDDDDDNDDEDKVLEEKRMRGVGRKRKKAGRNRDDDDDWTGDSAEDKELATEMRMVRGRNYCTRLKDDHGRSQKNVSCDQSLVQKRINRAEEEDNEEEESDEDDETLGGFIVDDDQVEPEEESELDGEEEEEEEDEDYDDDNGDG